MIATIAPSFAQVAAACFPVAHCTVRGYPKSTGYCLTFFPPQPWAGPAAYTGNGRTRYEALAAAVQLFHDSAHAYPDTRPLAIGSYSPPPRPQEFPRDDEELSWSNSIRTQHSTERTMQRLSSITDRMKLAAIASRDEQPLSENATTGTTTAATGRTTISSTTPPTATEPADNTPHNVQLAPNGYH